MIHGLLEPTTELGLNFNNELIMSIHLFILLDHGSGVASVLRNSATHTLIFVETLVTESFCHRRSKVH